MKALKNQLAKWFRGGIIIVVDVSIGNSNEYDKYRYLSYIRIKMVDQQKCEIYFSTKETVIIDYILLPNILNQFKNSVKKLDEKSTYKIEIAGYVFYSNKYSLGICITKIDNFIRFLINKHPDNIIFNYVGYSNEDKVLLEMIMNKAKRRQKLYEQTNKLPYGNKKLALLKKSFASRTMNCCQSEKKTLFINKELSKNMPSKSFSSYSSIRGVNCSMCENQEAVVVIDDNRTDNFLLGLCEEHLYQFIVLALAAYYDSDEGLCFELGDFCIIYDDFENEHCFFTGSTDELLYKVTLKNRSIYMCQSALSNMIKTLTSSAAFKEIFSDEYEIAKKLIYDKLEEADKEEYFNKLVNSCYDIQITNLKALKHNVTKGNYKITEFLTYEKRIKNNDVQLLPDELRKQCINSRSDFYYFNSRIMKDNGNVTLLNNSKEYAENNAAKDFYISYVSDLNYHLIPHKHKANQERVYGILELDRDDEFDEFSIPLCKKCLDTIIESLAKTNSTNPIYDNDKAKCHYRYYSSFPENKHCYFSGVSNGPCYEIQIGYVSFITSEFWKNKMLKAMKKIRHNLKAIMKAQYEDCEG